MRNRAEEVLKYLLSKHFPDMPAEEYSEITKEFKERTRF